MTDGQREAYVKIDLLLIRDGIRRGFEIKYTDSPANSVLSCPVPVADMGIGGLAVHYGAWQEPLHDGDVYH